MGSSSRIQEMTPASKAPRAAPPPRTSAVLNGRLGSRADMTIPNLGSAGAPREVPKQAVGRRL
ncbi:MAG: hypothetical protein QM765_12640 [Myxococcales bacterium]